MDFAVKKTDVSDDLVRCPGEEGVVSVRRRVTRGGQKALDEEIAQANDGGGLCSMRISHAAPALAEAR
jgi:hypothetical protein